MGGKRGHAEYIGKRLLEMVLPGKGKEEMQRGGLLMCLIMVDMQAVGMTEKDAEDRRR